MMSQNIQFPASAYIQELRKTYVRRFIQLSVIAASLLIFASIAFASAANVFIAQNAVGGANGADCADALPVSFFNASANWGSGSNQIGPGTTVHLCGTFNAPAGSSHYLVTQGGGTGTSPITILFENGAVIQAPYWSGSVIQITYNFITVNGGTNGLIQATANGTNLANQQDGGIGVNLVNASNVLVENMTIINLYVHVSGPDSSNQNTTAITASNGSNIQYKNNTVHDMHWAIGYGTSGGATTNNIEIGPENNVYNTDHAVFVADSSGSPHVSGVYVHGNHLHDFANWDQPSDQYHHDGVHIFTNNSGSMFTQIYVYGNLIDGNWGATDNAGIYFESADEGGQITSCGAFNNVLNRSGGSNASGAIADYSQNGCLTANNTIYTDALAVEFTVSGGSTLYNNIGYSQVSRSISAGDGGKLANSDYNDLFQLPAANAFIAPGSGCCINTLAQWIPATGFDVHTITGNPNLSSAFVPQSTSPVISAGKNLFSICSGQPNPGLGALCFDAAGTPRSSSGNWDIGAYTSNAVAGPSAPTDLTARAQ